LPRDAHVGGLRLVRLSIEFLLLILSLLLARLDKWLVAVRALNAVFLRVELVEIGAFGGRLFHLVDSQFEFGLNPLPNARVVEQVITLSLTNLFILFEVITADSTRVNLLLVLLFGTILLELDAFEIYLYFFSD